MNAGHQNPSPRRAARTQHKAKGSAITGSLTRWQALGALAASFVGIVYVLLNAGYVRFYEILGIHPEDVGFDRASVLARTAGLTLVALIVISAATALVVTIPHLKKHGRVIFVAFQALYLVFTLGTLMRWLPEDPLLPSSFLGISLILGLGFVATHEKLNKYFLVVLCLVAAYLLILTLALEADAVDWRISRARSGMPVRPVAIFGLPLLDFSTVYAHTSWLDKNAPPPPDLDDPLLLFVGRGTTYASFMACGRIVVVPTVKVSVETRPKLASKAHDPKRSKFCECIIASNESDCKKHL